MTSNSRKPRSDSVTTMLQAAVAAASAPLEPPACVTLDEADRPFWRAIIDARARSEWTEAELVIAANLARCWADIEKVKADIDRDGWLTESAAGTPKQHPNVQILDLLMKRSVLLVRTLQIQPAATRKLEHRIGDREAERQARSTAARVLDDDLLA